MTTIRSLKAREILDSRGNPTVEVDAELSDGSLGRAAIPSGASTGSREALELRDNDAKRFRGKGVQQAVANVRGPIAVRVVGMDAGNQAVLDGELCKLDGTDDKRRLGANAILGVSLAVARAAAASARVPLFRHLNKDASLLPVPMFNVVNGGAHADNNVDMQEFMIAPVGASSFAEALRMGAEVYQALKATLHDRQISTAVGDEGGFAPNLRGDEEAIEVVLAAITRAGLRPGDDVVLALDPAMSELWDEGAYLFRKGGGKRRSAAEMVDLWDGWVRTYPIASLEDGMAEQDTAGWKLITERLGKRIQLVGDDNLVTNPKLIRQAIADGIANAVLIKLNQIGTLTETLDAIAEARRGGYRVVISHRSGETSDDFIADLAVATSAGQIKTGAPCRGERVAKYNQLIRIEELLGSEARYAGRAPFVVQPV
jgi:enolase